MVKLTRVLIWVKPALNNHKISRTFMLTGSRISQEVKRIMQSSLPAAVTARSSDTGSSSATTRNPGSPSSGLVGGYRIPAANRRLRRRQSSKLMSLGTSSVSDSVAPRQASFSKKLFVFRYMHGAPKSFIRKNKDIVARGFINDICVKATPSYTLVSGHPPACKI